MGGVDLFKFKYIQCAWISIMKKQNNNQHVKVEKMVVFAKTFDYYHHKFSFGNFFSCPVKLWKNLNLKFRSKFNHGYLQSVVWTASYDFNPTDDEPFFETAHGLGGGGISCHDEMMTLGTVVPYAKKIQKIYKSHDTPLAFSWHEHFLTENQQILLYQEMQI